MPSFRITIQEAIVRERSYDVEATDEDTVVEDFYEDAELLTPVHEQIVNVNWEVVNVEPIDEDNIGMIPPKF